MGFLAGIGNPVQRVLPSGRDGHRREPTPASTEGSGAEALEEIERQFVHVFALVGEAIAGATHALLACDREAAKQLMARDDVVDESVAAITALAQQQLVSGR